MWDYLETIMHVIYVYVWEHLKAVRLKLSYKVFHNNHVIKRINVYM